MPQHNIAIAGSIMFYSFGYPFDMFCFFLSLNLSWFDTYFAATLLHLAVQCDVYLPFYQANKPVFGVEYRTLSSVTFVFSVYEKHIETSIASVSVFMNAR